MSHLVILITLSVVQSNQNSGKKITFSGCCKEIEITGKGTPEYSFNYRQIYIFQNYKLEPDLVNGKQHYTSQDGVRAFYYVDGIWMVSSVSYR